MHDLLFVLAGLFVGFTVGVTGVGGGSLMTPILISLLNIPTHIAIGTDLIYAAVSKFCGSLVHAKKLNIVWPIVIWIAVGSIPASIVTNLLLATVPGGAGSYKGLLTAVLGAMLTITGLSIIFRSKIETWVRHLRKDHNEPGNETGAVQAQSREASQPTHYNKPAMVLTGIMLGVLVTLSSVGAGVFGIMVLVTLFPQLPMIRIIGSDVAHAVLLTLVAGMGHLFTGNVDLHILGLLLIGSIPAIIAGTLLSSRLPERIIRPILGTTIFLLGLKFLLNPVKH